MSDRCPTCGKPYLTSSCVCDCQNRVALAEQPTTPKDVEAALDCAFRKVAYITSPQADKRFLTDAWKDELQREFATLRAHIEALTVERDKWRTEAWGRAEEEYQQRIRAEAAESERDTLRERVAKLEAAMMWLAQQSADSSMATGLHRKTHEVSWWFNAALAAAE